jgi:hypothetical protein
MDSGSARGKKGNPWLSVCLERMDAFKRAGAAMTSRENSPYGRSQQAFCAFCLVTNCLKILPRSA